MRFGDIMAIFLFTNATLYFILFSIVAHLLSKNGVKLSFLKAKSFMYLKAMYLKADITVRNPKIDRLFLIAKLSFWLEVIGILLLFIYI